MRSLLILAACLAVPCIAAPSALAAPPALGGVIGEAPPPVDLAAKAAELAKKGSELRAAGHWEEAAATFEASWRLDKVPATVVLLGECELRLGRSAPAAQHLAHALRLQEEGPERKRTAAFFDEARAKVGAIHLVTSVLGADIFANGRLVGLTPLVDDVFVEPGDVEILLKKAGIDEMRGTVKVAAAGTAPLRLEPGRLADDGEQWRPLGRSRMPIYALAAITVIAAGAGVGLYVAGGSKGSQADDKLAGLGGGSPCAAASPPADCATLKDLRTSHDSLVNAGTGAFVVGGAALIGTVAYAAWALQASAPPPATVSMVPVVSPSLKGLFVQGAF